MASNDVQSAIHVESVRWDDPSAIALRDAMEIEMRVRYADRLELRAASHAIAEVDAIAYVGVAFTADRIPVGHVALRWLDGELELKRLFVAAAHRGAGVSVALIEATDAAAVRLGAKRIILQTGDRQPDAVRLYERAGYTPIPIFAPYEALTYSLCFEKQLA